MRNLMLAVGFVCFAWTVLIFGPAAYDHYFAPKHAPPAKQQANLPIVDVMQRVTLKLETAGHWGTGVLVEHDGTIYVLTAKHVVSDIGDEGIKASCELEGCTAVANLKVVRTSEVSDLALLELGVFPLTSVAKLGWGLPKIGQEAYHYGACYGSLSFTRGYVSRLREPIAGNEYLQFTGLATPGSSGGGVFDAQGNLLGIITRATPGQFAWAVPLDAIQAFLDGTEKKPVEEVPPPPEEEKPKDDGQSET